MIIWVVEYTSLVNGWVAARLFNRWELAIKYANGIRKHQAYTKPHVFRVDKFTKEKN